MGEAAVDRIEIELRRDVLFATWNAWVSILWILKYMNVLVNRAERQCLAVFYFILLASFVIL